MFSSNNILISLWERSLPVRIYDKELDKQFPSGEILFSLLEQDNGCQDSSLRTDSRNELRIRMSNLIFYISLFAI